MQLTKIEKEVVKQSEFLHKEIQKYLKAKVLKGKFVAYFDGETLVGDTHEECFNKAEKKFGEKKGFAIDEVTEKTLIVSSLVKL